MAISVVVAVGDVADPLVEAIKARLPKLRDRARHRARQRDGPAHHPRAPRQGGRLPRQRGRAGRHGRGRRPGAARSPGDGFFLGVVADRRRRPRAWTATRTRSSGRCSASCGSTTYEEALRLVNDNPYGNGTAIFTRDGGAARQFQFDCQRRHGRRQRAHPGAGGVLQLRRLEGVAVRRHPHVRPGGHPVLHPGQGRHLPLARPGHLRGRPRASRRSAERTRTRGEQMDLGVVLQTTRPRGGSSSWPRRPSSTASATCGPSTPTCCGRSRSSSTARSWPTPAR